MVKMELTLQKSDHGEAFNPSRLIESQKIIDSGKKATKEETLPDTCQKIHKDIQSKIN